MKSTALHGIFYVLTDIHNLLCNVQPAQWSRDTVTPTTTLQGTIYMSMSIISKDLGLNQNPEESIEVSRSGKYPASSVNHFTQIWCWGGSVGPGKECRVEWEFLSGAWEVPHLPVAFVEAVNPE